MSHQTSTTSPQCIIHNIKFVSLNIFISDSIHLQINIITFCLFNSQAYLVKKLLQNYAKRDPPMLGISHRSVERHLLLGFAICLFIYYIQFLQGVDHLLGGQHNLLHVNISFRISTKFKTELICALKIYIAVNERIYRILDFEIVLFATLT